MSPSLAAVHSKVAQAEFSFATDDKPHALMMAAQMLVSVLAKGQPINVVSLRAAMEGAFGASDARGRLVLEGRLRGARGGADPVPAPVWPRDDRAREQGAVSRPGYALEDRGAATERDTALGREPFVAAVLDPAGIRLCGEPRCGYWRWRHRARAFRRHGNARDPCRARGRETHPQRMG